MMTRGGFEPCRRRAALRRLFFFSGLLGATAFSASAQTETTADGIQIVQRQVRVTWDEAGDYRIYEILHARAVADSGVDHASSGPIPLVRLQASVSEARAIGGDVPLSRVVYDRPFLSIVEGDVPDGIFQIGITYVLPRESAAAEFVAVVPVGELVLEVAAGSVEARPDRSLTRVDDGGNDYRPMIRYTTGELAADSTVRLALAATRADWRSRLAVLLATATLAFVVGVRVWRGRSSA
jgi:hypothetical protein